MFKLTSEAIETLNALKGNQHFVLVPKPKAMFDLRPVRMDDSVKMRVRAEVTHMRDNSKRVVLTNGAATLFETRFEPD